MNKFAAPLLGLALITAAPAAFAQIDSTTDIEASSAILDADQAAAQIRGLRNVPSIGVIQLQPLYGSPFSRAGNIVSKLQTYADKNQAAINHLRHALKANPVTRRVMAEHGVILERVIGVSIGSTGSLRVFEN